MTCGIGYRTHWRECNNPKPMTGGKFCEGAGMAQEECHGTPCPSILYVIRYTYHKNSA